ncbi:S-layer homology domain-containing protein [Paenibacillus sp. KACC 21273]|uniref:S-layer homology domain-containing protein n=1 Tax=Paenibacillus sp. KACC 21273 TaxID=3025665 RepID=UPI002365D172|nr:S-layer homology domain-containing protein [Paenibacillus sp. KACC 21273]WDF50963.1 S-layer homology domain-containing protein [Paenibacillus sp. KACC 21273]
MRRLLLKRIGSLSVISTLLLSGVAPFHGNVASASQAQTASSVFSDVHGHWGQSAIEKWNKYGIVKGSDGSFRPNEPVTRAEFAVMINNIMKYIEEGNTEFSDIHENQWYTDSIRKLSTASVLKGTDGKALPQNKITRQEAATLIAGAFQIDNALNTSAFKDNQQIAPWAKGSVQALASKAIIGGLPDGTFSPQKNLTRAEAVTIFDHLIHTLVTQPGQYQEDVQGNMVINTPNVVLNNSKITGDLYLTQGVGEGEVTLNNVTVSGSVYVQGGGEHSVIFNNSTVQQSLNINKYNGKVRIQAKGNTNIPVTILNSGASLVTTDGAERAFDSVEISSRIPAAQAVNLDGNFNKVTNQSSQASIVANGNIKVLVANVATQLTGNVKIDTTQTGSATVLVNGTTAPTAQSPTPTTNGTNAVTSFGSGGGGGGGTSTVAVKGVAIVPNTVSLQVGQSQQLIATVNPNTATNPQVIWAVAPESASIITVSTNGKVTAKAPGTAKVTATTRDGGFIATATVTVPSSTIVSGLTLSTYTDDLVDSTIAVDSQTVKNNQNVKVTSYEKSLQQEHHYNASLTAQAPLQKEKSSVTYAVYAVVGLTDSLGQPFLNNSAVQMTVTNNTYTSDKSQSSIQGYQDGKFLVRLNMSNPNEVNVYNVVASQNGSPDLSMQITYQPADVTPNPKNSEAVFASLEDQYLGSNSDASNIVSDLTLSNSLPDYEGVNINWTIDQEQAINQDGKVTRDQQNDQIVNVTATLSGTLEGSHTYNVIVRAQQTGIVHHSDYVDSYFVKGYPQAYVKDGTIHVKYALNKSGEVYMVIHGLKGAQSASVTSVLQGASETGIEPTGILAWPYFEINKNQVGQVQDFDTGVGLSVIDSDRINIEFVVKDAQSSYTSNQVTTLSLDEATRQEDSPYNLGLRTIYVNDARDTIRIYYYQKLDPNSVPSPEDFTWSYQYGGVRKVKSVSIHNYDTAKAWPASYVELKAENLADEVYVSYSGDRLQDLSPVPVKMPTYQNHRNLPRTEELNSLYISVDRKTIDVNINPGWYPEDNSSFSNDILSKFTVEVAGKTYHPISAKPSISVDAFASTATMNNLSYVLTFEQSLPEGEAVLKLDTNGVKNWAGDTFASELKRDYFSQMIDAGVPEAQYSQQSGQIALIFAPDYNIKGGSSNVAGMTVKVDGQEYLLRGTIASGYNFKWTPEGHYQGEGNLLFIDLNDPYAAKVKEAMDKGQNIEIKYTRSIEGFKHQLADRVGTPLSDFGYVSVTKVNE